MGVGKQFSLGMEEITCKCDNMSLSAREGKSVILSKKRQESKFVLAAKFYTRRALNMEAMARTFRPLWRTKESFHISNAGNNILLFDFEVGRFRTLGLLPIRKTPQLTFLVWLVLS